MADTPAPLCFIDTETTGVHVARQVWEVAIIRRDPGRPDQERQFYVEVDLSEADPFGLEVGHFYDRHPYGRWLAKPGGPGNWLEPPQTYDSFGGHSEEPPYLSRSAAADAVAKLTHRAHIFGMVPSFDTTTLETLLRQYVLQPSWHYQPIDVETLAVGWLKGSDRWDTMPSDLILPPYDSEEISRALGVEPPVGDQRHTALGDARWARDLYDRMFGAAPST